MPGEADADRALLEAIRDYCSAQVSRPLPPTPDAQARRRAYGKVARAARELLQEMEG